MSMKRDQIIAAIEAERTAQDAKWGGHEHDVTHTPKEWCDFLWQRVGYVSAASAGRLHPTPDYERRLIQVAALAIAAIEAEQRASDAVGE